VIWTDVSFSKKLKASGLSVIEFQFFKKTRV
jgi:hypothetical protein